MLRISRTHEVIVGYMTCSSSYLLKLTGFRYGIMTEELVIREIGIDEAAGRGDSDSRMTGFEVTKTPTN